MRRFKFATGYSLIEVVLATGIVAVGVVTMLGLLAGMSRQLAEADEWQTAGRMPEAVAVELNGLARQMGLEGLAAAIPVMTTGETSGFLLVAGRDGSGIHPLVSGDTGERDAYFLIEVKRFPAGDLAFSPESMVLPVNVRVSWPYRVGLPEPRTVSPAERQHFFFNLAVVR